MQQDINMLPLIERATKDAMRTPLHLTEEQVMVYAKAALAKCDLDAADSHTFFVAFCTAYMKREEMIRQQLERQGKERE